MSAYLFHIIRQGAYKTDGFLKPVRTWDLQHFVWYYPENFLNNRRMCGVTCKLLQSARIVQIKYRTKKYRVEKTSNEPLLNFFCSVYLSNQNTRQLFTSYKSTIETLEKSLKYVHINKRDTRAMF